MRLRCYPTKRLAQNRGSGHGAINVGRQGLQKTTSPPAAGEMALSAELWSYQMEGGLWVWLLLKEQVEGTHRGEGIVQVVDSPGDDDDVVDVQPEGQHSRGKAHSWEGTHPHDTRLTATIAPVHVTVIISHNVYNLTRPWREAGSWLRSHASGK